MNFTAQVGARCRRVACPCTGAGLTLYLWPAVVAAVALGAWAAPAWGITVDGLVSAGEWDEASIVLTDPNETDYTDNQYDIAQIMLAGGDAMYMRMDVYAPPVTMVGRQGKASLVFINWTLDTDPGAKYVLTVNDGFGFTAGEMHLLRRETTWDYWLDLGQVTYATGPVLEAMIPWSLFPAGVIPAPGGEVAMSTFQYVFESGDDLADDFEDGMDIERNDPLPVVPEPITLVTLLAGCATAAWRLRRRWPAQTTGRLEAREPRKEGTSRLGAVGCAEDCT